MSGGSFNYLYIADSGNIQEKRADIADMQDKLIEYGYLDAAKETESLLLLMDSFEVRVEARLKRLSKVWKAVEWECSMDSSREDIEKEIKKYRGE